MGLPGVVGDRVARVVPRSRHRAPGRAGEIAGFRPGDAGPCG